MEYIKVKWLHQFEDEPILLLSELDNQRFEVRKMEFYADGRIGFASGEISAGQTMLGEVAMPSAAEISSDTAFLVEELSADEFDSLWMAAVASKSDLQRPH